MEFPSYQNLSKEIIINIENKIQSTEITIKKALNSLFLIHKPT